jgi:PIN domain nuclease of toxin-antitoxin system
MIVLDTHAFIWWADESPRLSARARHALDQADVLGVCAISCWEIAMLVERERLRLDRDVLEFLRQALALPRVELLPLSPEVSVAAARLGAPALADPADRMIAATALEAGAALVSKDARLRGVASLKTIW